MPAPPDLRALLLTDVVDSTQLTEQLGDAAMAELWTVHDRIARDLLPLWRGREIDKTDGMLLLFDDVRDAVGYALAYHLALAARELPFKARAGIHVGPVSLRPNPPQDVARGAKPVEVDGIALPIAARVMSVALGAQTLLSADARLALGVVAHRVVSHGHWRMHGVAEPVELFEVGAAGHGGQAPFKAPPDGAKVYRVMRQGELWQPLREVRHSVPAERDSFVGRQEPLQLLAQKFDDGARLVSVLGMGGTGKTRLVTRFAWTVLGDYPGGVWFCDLSQARTVDGIHSAVAHGLGVALGRADPAIQLGHAIAVRGRCLVILDNFEQVAGHAEGTLGHWLDRAPQAQFLVTTREVLGIAGEETMALAPLPSIDAIALFGRRAVSAQPDFVPDSRDSAAIEQLVKVLDGLPLAIELAAARVRVMPPQVLLARMHARFDVLLSRAGRRDRQATLRAAFDWSWELLSEAEKAALAQLSVFEGGFTLESADVVLDLTATADATSTVDVVEWLVDKSFLRPLGQGRFDMLESVREYASEHLRSEGRYEHSGPLAQLAAQSRHGRFYAAAGMRPSSLWPSLELDNLVAACKRAVSRGDALIAIHTLAGAWGPLRLRGPFRVATELASLVRQIDDRLDEVARAELDLIQGGALDLCGLLPQAEPHLVAAAQAGRSLGKPDIEGRALNGLAQLQARQGLTAQAEASSLLALSNARAAADTALTCSVLNQLGSVLEAQGRPDDARARYEEALTISRERGDRRWEGGSAGNLGQFLANQGRLDEARELYAQSVAIARELGDRQWEANARCNLGLLQFSEGRLGESRLELEAALQAAREMGHVRLLCIVQCNLGLVAEALGSPGEALARYTEAVEMARDLNDRRSEGQFLGYLGLLHARASRIDAARKCLRHGAELLTAMADRTSLAILLCAEAEAEAIAGDHAAANVAIDRAQALADVLGQVDSRSELGTALGRAREMLLPVTSPPNT